MAAAQSGGLKSAAGFEAPLVRLPPVVCTACFALCAMFVGLLTPATAQGLKRLNAMSGQSAKGLCASVGLASSGL